MDKLHKTTPKNDPYRLNGILLADKYLLKEYAGGGGMGAVYLAFNENTKQKVAVKILKPDIVARNQEYIRLFEQEIQAAQQIDHPNIVKIFDSGTQEDLSFMVMEWLDGYTLEDEIMKKKLSFENIVNIFRQICAALITAHSKNILHLDIKPANIFLLSNLENTHSVKVIDFGLARILSSDTGTTATRFRGTDKYCSPEHYGGKLTNRSDIYSLGATLYHMVAGVIPFGTSYIYAKMYPNMEMPIIPSILKQRPDFPEQLDEIIQKSLAKNPEDRQESVESLLSEIEQVFSCKIAPCSFLESDVSSAIEIDDLAPMLMRFDAGLFDLIIGAFINYILLFPFNIQSNNLFTFEGLLVFLITYAIVMFIYLTVATSLRGKTFGMKLFMLEIVDIEENVYPTFYQAFIRTLTYLISLTLGNIGFLTMLFNRERRAAHDLLSGTIVVREYNFIEEFEIEED